MRGSAYAEPSAERIDTRGRRYWWDKRHPEVPLACALRALSASKKARELRPDSLGAAALQPPSSSSEPASPHRLRFHHSTLAWMRSFKAAVVPENHGCEEVESVRVVITRFDFLFCWFPSFASRPSVITPPACAVPNPTVTTSEKASSTFVICFNMVLPSPQRSQLRFAAVSTDCQRNAVGLLSLPFGFLQNFCQPGKAKSL